jgi:hypothetical protein
MIDAPEAMPSKPVYDLPDRGEVYLVGDLYDPILAYFYNVVMEMNEAQEVPEGNLSLFGVPTDENSSAS